MSFHGADLAAPARVRRPPTTPCGHCGSTPTVDESFELRLGSSVTDLPGPFCRDCGLATFRTATASTLAQGWWGPTFFMTPMTVIGNLETRSRVRKLAAPQDPTEGRRPMATGRSLWFRWQIIGVLAPLLFVGAVGLLVNLHIHSEHVAITRNVGQCVHDDSSSTVRLIMVAIVPCDQPHQGRITRDAQAYNGCHSDEEEFYVDALNIYYCVKATTN